MNLIERQLEENNVILFRQKQYDLIEPLIDNCVFYLKSLGFQYDDAFYKKSIENDLQYVSIYSYSSKIIKVNTNENPKEYLIVMSIPDLINKMFFRLNGAFYIPQLYIADSPITEKKSSIFFYSLFQSMTINKKEGSITFLKSNIVLSRFLMMFYEKKEVEQICKLLNINYINETENNSLQTMSAFLKCSPEKEEIQKIINLLFFDHWTTSLYKKYYNLENIDVKTMFDIFINRAKKQEKLSFIDLKNKRIVFIEYLLSPLFKATANAAIQLLKGNQPKYLLKDFKTITNHFNKDLERANFYNIVNGLSGSLSLKASFKNPRGSVNLPKVVSNIHESYKGKICTVTVSNQNPGRVVSLVPTIKIDMFGIIE
jgi:hypothetical protein